MTTSGTIAWNPVLERIIQKALLNVGAIDENEAAGSPAYYDALESLNGLVKLAEATGIHVWTESEGIMFPQVDTARYVFGTGGDVKATDANEWLELVTDAAAAAGASTILVADDDGVSDGDNIGIVLTSGVIQWTTVNGAPAANVITLDDTLDEAVDDGAIVITYTTTLSRPLRIPRTRLLTLQPAQALNYLETPMTVLSRQEYMDLPQKRTQGTPTQFFYTPQRETGELYIWPVPSITQWAVRFTYYRSLQDFLIPTNTADFPQEWVLPLIWNLSKELMTGYGVPDATAQRITAMADQYALTVISYDRESEPIQFGMDWQFGE